jgi:hypothetical protein
MAEMTLDDSGLWFSRQRGLDIENGLQREAIRFGYEGAYIPFWHSDCDCAKLLRFATPASSEPDPDMEIHTAEEHERLHNKAVTHALRYLNRVAPTGYYVGYNEAADFGLWHYCKGYLELRHDVGPCENCPSELAADRMVQANK